MLDHPKIDIFIHMDAKNKSHDPTETLKLVKFCRVIHAPRIKVSWGGYSQIGATLILFEATTQQGRYGHYHLISGADLPIQMADDIEIKGRRGSMIVRFFSRISLKLQKLFHVHRNKAIKFQKGGQWFSITDEFARYILSKRDWIRKVFHDTICCDEIFLHTVLVNSAFIVNRSNSMRLIDWQRGSPYTFRLSDLEQLKASNAMFARKFHPSVDAEIIERIREIYS